jgi:hypothetical protein
VLTELDDAEAILGCARGGPTILLGNIAISKVDSCRGLRIYGLVVQGYLPPMDS